MTAKPKHHSLFILGLDGATFDLIDPWMQAGELPVLHDLAQSGIRGELQSTFPPITGPAWASFMTGKSPANHGVLEFFRRIPDGYAQVLNSRHDIDGRSIWRVLSDAGKKVGVLGVPLTYPPEAVNGFLVTGLLTPRQPDVTFTYPPDLGRELNERLGRYLLQHTETYSKDPNRFVCDEQAILDNLIEAALYLMHNKEWDCFMLHILGTDLLQHRLWHLTDPSHLQYDPALRARYGDPVLDYWKRIDKHLGVLLAELPRDAHIMVISDHGFGPVDKYVNFNVWLLRNGFLRLKPDIVTQLKHLAFRLGYNYSSAVRISSRLGVIQHALQLGRGKRESLQRKAFLSLDDVDWSRTAVYSAGNFGQMYVNLKGREPQGSVSPGKEYERVLQKLESQLRDMRDPATGDPVIAQIWRGHELFAGKYVERAPDLFFFTRDMRYKAMGLSDFGSNSVFDDLYGTLAHHHMNGVFILCGPHVRPGEQIEGARLIDLAPTVYALLGVPIPRDVDGRPLSQAFVPGSEPVFHYEEDSPAHDLGPGPEEGYLPDEEALIRERLRSLGYAN